MTKIEIKDPDEASKNDSHYKTYITITEAMLTTIDSITSSYIK